MITIEEQGNGILFNGALTDKQGWVLTHSNSTPDRCSISNRLTGVSASGLVTEVEVGGTTYADFDALAAALGSLLFKGSGSGSGTEWGDITGDLSDQADLNNALAAKADAADLANKLDVGTGTQNATTFRRGDGTWAVPPNTTYSALSQAAAQDPASTTVGLATGQRLSQAVEGRIVAVSGSKTLALTDRLTYQNVTATATITVPPNSSVALPVGSVVQGFGQGVSVTIAAGSGVTIHSKDSNLSTAPNTAFSLKKVATDVWHLVGDLQ